MRYVSFVLLVTLLVPATSHAQDVIKDLDRPDFIEQGLVNVNAFCSRCHGMNGKGGKGPDLTSGKFRRVTTDEDIIRIISSGIPGTGMPGFGTGFDDYFWPIVAYMRAQSKKRENAPQAPAGDVVRGTELFKQHKCASCHWTGSDGGRLGSDLSRIAATPDHVRSSMKYANLQIDSSYQLLRLLMDDGRILSGRRLHENSYFVLMMDQQENLRTIPKSRVEEIRRPHESLMPSFDNLLKKEDIEDLTTYIFSLRKELSK